MVFVLHVQLLLHVELELQQHLLLQLRELCLRSPIWVCDPGQF